MVPTKQHQQHTHSRREEEQSVLRKHIRVEQPTSIFHPHGILTLLVDTIERRKVNIRRRLVNIPIRVRRAETRVNDERREREHQR